MNLLNNAERGVGGGGGGKQVTEEYTQHDSTPKAHKLTKLNNTLFGIHTNYKAEIGNV